MGFFDGIGSALVGGAMSLFGGSQRNSAQSAQAANANALTKEQFEKSLAFNSAEANLARNFNAAEAARTRRFSAREAQKSRVYNRQMSNSAIQRQMRDLKRAGLNPILAARGDGAPIGSSAMAQSANASGSAASSGGGGSYQQASIRDAISTAVSSAVGAMNATSQARQTSSNVELQKTQQDVNRSTITTQEVERHLKDSQIDVNNKQQAYIMKMVDKLDADMDEILSRMKVQDKDAQIKAAEAVIRRYEASITEQLKNLSMGKDAAGILTVIKQLLTRK